MARIRKPRDIVDAKALGARLDAIVGDDGFSPAAQARVMATLKEARDRGVAEIRHRFETGGTTGIETAEANAYLVDHLVQAILDFALVHAYPHPNPTTGEQMALAATGGYGRGQMAPFSDVDLMFLLPYKQTAHTEQVVEYVLYSLWDLGFKVGHATRSVDDAIRLATDDLTIRTSLIEARRLWGDEALFRAFQRRFEKEVVARTGPDFVEAKLAERNARHERMGDTRYVLEPNMKEGKGGLRDLQTLMWIAKYLYRVRGFSDLVPRGLLTDEDARAFAKAENFLWTTRCHLHYLAGRAEERLTFNVQGEIGRRMGYRDHAGTRGVERFMKHYFLVAKEVGDLTRILCAVLEEKHKKRRFRIPSLSFRRRAIEGFRVDNDRIDVEGDDALAAEPIKVLRLFREAQRHGLDIHPRALRLVTRNLRQVNGRLRANREANRLFLEMLTDRRDPETTLKRLNEAGVFGRFMPDFGRVVAQMQYDMYHVFTVDEHTIRAIGILSRIDRGELKEAHPTASAVVGEIESRAVLYLAVLLHDIAKGRGGDHSVIGAEIALKVGRRFALSEWETETLAWLVRHHLLMSLTAFKRDLDDPKTISDFVEIVQSPERLRLLLVLTIADIRAVGPNVWNEWKANLLREIYLRADEEMTGGRPSERRDQRVERARHALAERLAGWSPDEVEAHLALGYPDYWLGFDAHAHVRHAELIREAARAATPLRVETRLDSAHGVTEVVIYTADHPGLFARIAGAMSLSGATIVDARIVTLANGMALDTFAVQDPDGGGFDAPERLKRLTRRIEGALSGRLHVGRALEAARQGALPSRTQVFKVAPRVLIDNKASATHTVIEVTGRDRLGFLYDVTNALTSLGLQIASAHVTTYGERAVDVFYVKDVFGLKVERDDKLDAIRDRLLKAIQPPAAREAPAKETVAAAE